MTTKIPDLQVIDRDMSVNPRQLRREGRLPATVYGKKTDPVSIDLDKKTFSQLYTSQALHLVTLDKGGERLRALVKNVQTDPITYEVLNVEFLRVSEDEKVTLNVALVLDGEAPAFKKGATMLQLMDEVEVQCLPKYIVDSLHIDMTQIEDVDATITVGDVAYPEGVEPVSPPETPILRISPPKGTAGEDEEGEGEATEAAAPVTAEA